MVHRTSSYLGPTAETRRKSSLARKNAIQESLGVALFPEGESDIATLHSPTSRSFRSRRKSVTMDGAGIPPRRTKSGGSFFSALQSAGNALTQKRKKSTKQKHVSTESFFDVLLGAQSSVDADTDMNKDEEKTRMNDKLKGGRRGRKKVQERSDLLVTEQAKSNNDPMNVHSEGKHRFVKAHSKSIPTRRNSYHSLTGIKVLSMLDDGTQNSQSMKREQRHNLSGPGRNRTEEAVNRGQVNDADGGIDESGRSCNTRKSKSHRRQSQHSVASGTQCRKHRSERPTKTLKKSKKDMKMESQYCSPKPVQRTKSMYATTPKPFSSIRSRSLCIESSDDDWCNLEIDMLEKTATDSNNIPNMISTDYDTGENESDIESIEEFIPKKSVSKKNRNDDSHRSFTSSLDLETLGETISCVSQLGEKSPTGHSRTSTILSQFDYGLDLVRSDDENEEDDDVNFEDLYDAAFQQHSSADSEVPAPDSVFIRSAKLFDSFQGLEFDFEEMESPQKSTSKKKISGRDATSRKSKSKSRSIKSKSTSSSSRRKTENSVRSKRSKGSGASNHSSEDDHDLSSRPSRRIISKNKTLT